MCMEICASFLLQAPTILESFIACMGMLTLTKFLALPIEALEDLVLMQVASKLIEAL